MQTELAPRQLPFAIRPAIESDLGFVAQCWVREFRCSNGRLRKLDSHLFNRFCYPRVKHWLETSTVRVACPPGDAVTLYGFAVFSEDLMHMVYVLNDLRRLGIAKALLDGVDWQKKAWTTPTEDVEKWVKQKHDLYRQRHVPFWMIEVDHGSSTGTTSPSANGNGERGPDSSNSFSK